MNLHYLTNGLINEMVLDAFPDIPVRGITDTSKNVQEGFLFVAIKGHSSNGHSYIPDAIKKGAVAIVGEEEANNLSVPYLKVENSRKALGTIAKRFYKDPSNRKITIGITGTNGKTTVSFLLRHILEQNGLSCSLIGTIKNIVNKEEVPSINTTPNILTLNELLCKSKDDVVVMEASSHGLAQYRLEGVEFDYCLFTNLSHDHLDYHGSMEQYFQAKAELFKKLKKNGQAIVNIDDGWGQRLKDSLNNQGVKVLSIGNSCKADLTIRKILSKNSLIKISDHQEQQIDIRFNMAGTHNLYNAVMAFAVARPLHISSTNILSAIQSFEGIAGRFELFTFRNGATIIIDYAHTADAIFHCLNAAKDRGAKKLTHIFGFRGNRDQDKREEMLKVSAELSDQYILTLDDLNSVPYGEMEKDLELLNREFGNEKGLIILDRTEAIKHALNQSDEHDWIVITGKGHEKYQQHYTLPTSSDIETVMHLNDQNT